VILDQQGPGTSSDPHRLNLQGQDKNWAMEVYTGADAGLNTANSVKRACLSSIWMKKSLL
jgi:hypothetical protein